MNERVCKRSGAGCLRLIALALMLLFAPGCADRDPNNTLSTLAGDLVRQVGTWWLL